LNVSTLSLNSLEVGSIGHTGGTGAVDITNDLTMATDKVINTDNIISTVGTIDTLNTSGTATIDTADITTANITTANITTANIDTITNLNVSTLSLNSLEVGSIGHTGGTGSLDITNDLTMATGKVIYTDNLVSTSGDITTLDTTTGNIDTVNSTGVNSTDVNTTNLTVGSIGHTGGTGSLDITNDLTMATGKVIYTDNLVSTSGDITTLDATTGNVDTVNSTGVNSTDVNTTNLTVGSIGHTGGTGALDITNDLTMATGKVINTDNLVSTDATITTLDTTTGNIDTVNSDTVNSTAVNATSITVDNIGLPTNSSESILDFTSSVRVSTEGKAFYARTVGTGILQSYGGGATNIEVLDDLTLKGNNFIKCRNIYNTVDDAGGDMNISSYAQYNRAINIETRASPGYCRQKFLGTTIYNTGNNNTATSLTISPSVSNSSDSRMKHKIEPLDFALDKLAELEFKTYMKTSKINEETDADGNVIGQSWREFGVIAQEAVKTSFEFSVDAPTDLETGAYAINYNNLFVAGLRATQELHDIVKSQNDLITKLEARIVSLESKE